MGREKEKMTDQEKKDHMEKRNNRIKMERCVKNLVTKSRKYKEHTHALNVLECKDKPLKDLDSDTDPTGIFIFAVDGTRGYIGGEGVLYEKFKNNIQVPNCRYNGRRPSNPGERDYYINDLRTVTFESSFSLRSDPVSSHAHYNPLVDTIDSKLLSKEKGNGRKKVSPNQKRVQEARQRLAMKLQQRSAKRNASIEAQDENVPLQEREQEYIQQSDPSSAEDMNVGAVPRTYPSELMIQNNLDEGSNPTYLMEPNLHTKVMEAANATLTGTLKINHYPVPSMVFNTGGKPKSSTITLQNVDEESLRTTHASTIIDGNDGLQQKKKNTIFPDLMDEIDFDTSVRLRQSTMTAEKLKTVQQTSNQRNASKVHETITNDQSTPVGEVTVTALKDNLQEVGMDGKGSVEKDSSNFSERNDSNAEIETGIEKQKKKEELQAVTVPIDELEGMESNSVEMQPKKDLLAPISVQCETVFNVVHNEDNEVTTGTHQDDATAKNTELVDDDSVAKPSNNIDSSVITLRSRNIMYNSADATSRKRKKDTILEADVPEIEGRKSYNTRQQDKRKCKERIKIVRKGSTGAKRTRSRRCPRY